MARDKHTQITLEGKLICLDCEDQALWRSWDKAGSGGFLQFQYMRPEAEEETLS